MDGSARVPWSDPARSGSDHDARLGADELVWSEVADAIYLTSAVSATERRPPGKPPAEEPQPTETPPRDTATESLDRIGHTDGGPDRYTGRETTRGAWVGQAGPRADYQENELVAESVPGEPAPETAGHVEDRMPLDQQESSAIIRALRPLKRKVLSWREDEVVLDEEATAERAVRDGLWFPAMTPDTRRWLDLTLVVDGSPSMALWSSAIRAFTTLLEQSGVFGTIQRRLLDTRRPAGESPAVPVLRGGTPDTPARDPAELVDPTGRRFVLVLTDAVDAVWRQGLVAPMLARWGAMMPTAVVNVLPQRLWRRNGLRVHRARLTAPRALAPNRRWRLDLPDSWVAPEPVPGPETVAVPVLELGARWISWWSKLVSAGHDTPLDALVLLADENPAAGTDQDTEADDRPKETDARRRVQHFFNEASPTAARLATLLAAVPVSLPVAKVVQTELVPESGTAHLVEVLTSGLLRPPQGPDHEWDRGTFHFRDSVREVLLSGARRSETAQVIHTVTRRFGHHIRALRHLHAALEAPDTTPDPEISADAQDVELEQAIMRALSGPYLSRADRLRHSLRHPAGGPSETIGGQRVTPQDQSAKQSAMTTIRSGAGARTDELDQPIGPGAPAPEHPAPPAVPPSVAATGPSSTPPANRARRPDDVPLVWGDIPPRNPNFTGRQELLDQLTERLKAGGTTVVLPAALHGMGGIGKTQMAVEYIYRHLHEYDLVWWIQATQAAQIRASLTELARQLGLPGSNDANTAIPAVREALRRGQPYGRWLLVFDAAESPDIVRSFFPANGPGDILITSRNPDWAGIARPLEVAVFKRAESTELLRRRGPEINDEDADQLAGRLGDLPLAIEQAAAWRAETGMPVREYVRLFDEKVEEILDTSPPADYDVSVAAAWNVSFDELRVRSPAAHQLLQVCAFFAPEPIPRSLFVGVRGVSISPELDSALRNPMQLSRAIRDINRYGLAKIDHRNDTILLHRLVQVVLRNRMTPQQHAQMRHGAHLLLANLDPNDPESGKHWSAYQDLMPHATAADAADCEDSWVRQLVLNQMRFLFTWGDHEEAAKLGQHAYETWSTILGPTDPQTLDAASRLGLYLWALGRYREAADLNQRTLKLRIEVSGENSEETLGLQTNILDDLRATGDFPAALKLSEEILLKSRKLFGDDDPDTLTAAFRHGISLRYNGHYRAAAKLDEDTYLRRIEVLGYDHPSTLSTYFGLVVDRREAGDWAWVLGEMEKIYKNGLELYGDDRVVTWERAIGLAIARRKNGNHHGALELSRPALAYLRSRDGDERPRVMSCALAHSIDLRHAGELDEAHELGEQTFDRYRRTFSETHPFTRAAAINLAVTLRLLGQVEPARQLDERSFENLRERLGADHPYAITAAINLASDLAALGETDSALTIGNEVLPRSERFLGEDHPTTLAARFNLALDLRAAGNTQEAETRNADALTRYRRTLGEQHPATIGAAQGTRANCDIDPLPL